MRGISIGKPDFFSSADDGDYSVVGYKPKKKSRDYVVLQDPV
jgi:hypothetical protein